VLVEESVLGWKEFEYEVMRDGADNCITICSMENLDPMGVHTGESIVVAPAQTLSDSDHQTLRSAALRIIRALGVEGGCNIQFAVHPKTGEYRVIEVNPRVSRSSALASKATGYPIARIAAKIAIGLCLDEIPNPVTGERLLGIAEAVGGRLPTEKFASLREWESLFIEKIRHLVRMESGLRGSRISKLVLAEAKRFGFADESRSALTGGTEESVRRGRPRVAYKMVDTCGGEVEAETPYFYSTYEPSGETQKLAGRTVLIVGSGPIRIGQGVEFDYCCVQGILALREEGVAAIIANNNPETVSTDFDISTRLYFEPLLLEDVLNIIEEDKPDGVIVQFGGQ